MQGRGQAIFAVYLSGFIQGVALILYPAAGSILTDAEGIGLSSGQYGVLFTPQILMAIVASFYAPRLARGASMQRVLIMGLVANVLSMLLLTSSAFVVQIPYLSFILLMLGTAALGTAFGFTVTAVNPYAYSFFPGKEASAVTGLHILLGLGTAASSLVVAYFLKLGFWWGSGLALGAAALLLATWVGTLSMPLQIDADKSVTEKSRRLPARAWLFFVLVFLYGACEATFGNWTPIYLKKQAGLSAEAAAFGLSLFWGAAATGRFFFALAALRFNLRWIHAIMPVLVALVFFVMPQLEGQQPHYAAVTLGGLALSFYFPYSFSLATDEFPKYSAAVSGMLVAGIQLGTGISSNVIGFLNNRFPLSELVQFSTVYALLMAGIAGYLYLTRPATLAESVASTG